MLRPMKRRGVLVAIVMVGLIGTAYAKSKAKPKGPVGPQGTQDEARQLLEELGKPKVDYAALTKKGLELRKEMWKTYKKLIQDHFSDKLTQTDHADLMRILKKVWQEPEREDTPGCGVS